MPPACPECGLRFVHKMFCEYGARERYGNTDLAEAVINAYREVQKMMAMTKETADAR